MKTKKQIYSNLYEKARKDRKINQGVIEFVIMIIITLIITLFIAEFTSINNPFFCLILTALCLIYLCFVGSGKVSIFSVSERRIIKKMRDIVDEDIRDAKESNFSCEEQIKKLEKIKETII